LDQQHKRYWILLWVGLLLSSASSGAIQTNDVLIVLRQDGVAVRLEFEQARGAVALKRGLMLRDYLAPRSGMLFDFKRSSRVGMWMKDTLIPLDMLFVSENGTLVQIEEDASPQSLMLISSRVPVRYVLEINAGEVRKLGFSIGDQLLLPEVNIVPQPH
jgi:uncharacterized membrane protein (UPF0127 family)